jgi:hypothetical protein
LETLAIAIWGLEPRRPLYANGKICHIRTWLSWDFKPPKTFCLMNYATVNTCPNGAVTFSMTIAKLSNSLG